MGLLDMAPQQPQIGGLLGGQPQGESASADPMKLLNMLSQSPTPETVQGVIQIMTQSGRPEANQMAELLIQLKTPEQIKNFADQILRQKSGAING